MKAVLDDQFDAGQRCDAFGMSPSGVTAFCGLTESKPEGTAASSFTSVSPHPMGHARSTKGGDRFTSISPISRDPVPQIVWPATDPDAEPLVFHRSDFHNVAPAG